MHCEKIVSVQRMGKRRVVDIEVGCKSHLFYANGIATSNSHAHGYGEGSYWTAYMKAHFPHQFYCSYIDGASMKQDTQEEVRELVNDAKINGIDIMVPRLKDKQGRCYVKGETVFFGLGDIKKIGAASLKKILLRLDETEKEVSGDWKWLDYLVLFSDGVSSTANEGIISCGSVDYFDEQRSSMLYQISMWNKLTKKEKEWIREEYLTNGADNLCELIHRCGHQKKEGGGCSNKNRVEIVMGIYSLLFDPPHSLEDTPDMIAWMEEKYLGISITCSKVDGCEDAIKANAMCIDMVRGRGGYSVIAVEINRAQEIKTKKGKSPGKKMAFIGGSDSSCGLDNLVAFPEEWKEFGGLLHEGNTVLIMCEKKDDSLIIKRVQQI